LTPILAKKRRFFKKLGEVCAARIPEKVSFNQATSHSWSNQSKYLQSSAALESLGFQKARTFIASPQKWVAEFWLGSRFGLFAKIIDSEQRHVYVEITRTRWVGALRVNYASSVAGKSLA
jgi:hypothetical protein